MILIRSILVCLAVSLFWLTVGAFAPSALALTQIELFDLSYTTCPPELASGMVTSGSSQEAKCYMVTGKANNKSGKTVYDADVFGRVYDANNNPAMQNRSRLGLIGEIPPGISDFKIRISVAANQPEPLKLQQFKAAGFASSVRRWQTEVEEEAVSDF